MAMMVDRFSGRAGARVPGRPFHLGAVRNAALVGRIQTFAQGHTGEVEEIGRALMRLECVRRHLDDEIASLRRIQARITN